MIRLLRQKSSSTFWTKTEKHNHSSKFSWNLSLKQSGKMKCTQSTSYSFFCITVEEPHKRKGPVQCTDCQEYGHTRAWETSSSRDFCCPIWRRGHNSWWPKWSELLNQTHLMALPAVLTQVTVNDCRLSLEYVHDVSLKIGKVVRGNRGVVGFIPNGGSFGSAHPWKMPRFHFISSAQGDRSFAEKWKFEWVLFTKNFYWKYPTKYTEKNFREVILWWWKKFHFLLYTKKNHGS